MQTPYPAACRMEMSFADVHAHTYTDNSIISPKDNEELAYYREHIHMPAIITDDIISALDKEPFKLILIQLDGKDKLEAFRNTLESRTGDKLHTFYSSSVYLECCMKEASNDMEWCESR